MYNSTLTPGVGVSVLFILDDHPKTSSSHYKIQIDFLRFGSHALHYL